MISSLSWTSKPDYYIGGKEDEIFYLSNHETKLNLSGFSHCDKILSQTKEEDLQSVLQGVGLTNYFRKNKLLEVKFFEYTRDYLQCHY